MCCVNSENTLKTNAIREAGLWAGPDASRGHNKGEAVPRCSRFKRTAPKNICPNCSMTELH